MSTAWDATGTPDQGRGPVGAAPSQYPRPWSTGEMVAWVAIILLAGFAAVLAVFEQKAAAAAPEENANLRLISKLAVGLNELSKGSPTHTELTGDLEKTAKTPGDHLR